MHFIDLLVPKLWRHTQATNTAVFSQSKLILQAAGPAKLLEELLQSPAESSAAGRVEREGCSPTMLILVVLSCCLGACLAMQPIAEHLIRAAAAPLGNLQTLYMDLG